MDEQRLGILLKYYGVSPWEIEVIYGLFNDRFLVNQEETEITEPGFVSRLNVVVPLSFNEEFFKWFEFRRWERVKAIFKEMKRRRGSGKAIKIDLSFEGKPKIRFVIDADERQFFNNSIEKMDFVLELIPYHLEPTKLPGQVNEIIYGFDINTTRWKLNTVFVDEQKFVMTEKGWKDST